MIDREGRPPLLMELPLQHRFRVDTGAVGVQIQTHDLLIVKIEAGTRCGPTSPSPRLPSKVPPATAIVFLNPSASTATKQDHRFAFVTRPPPNAAGPRS
jgi:hypothetical protein